MLRTFNMGIGMLLVVPAKKFKKVQTILDRAGEKAFSSAASSKATGRCSTPEHAVAKKTWHSAFRARLKL